jgi:hypothetical protein
MSNVKQPEYHYEVKGRDGKTSVVTLYLKGELYNADGTPAKFIGEGADSLKAYKRSIATKKVVGRPKNL